MGRARTRSSSRVSALVLVVLGSALGAPLRYVIDREVQSRHERIFPFGTMAINVVGSFCLGLVVGAGDELGLSPLAVTALGTGLLGAFTTFSTFIWETLRMLEERSHWSAFFNVFASIGAGLLAAYAGLAIV
jgi:CrcB protein